MKRLICLFLGLSAYTAAVAQKADFTVAQDGSGNFTTIQQAVNAVPDYRKKPTVIFIKKGTYKEKLVLAASKQLVHFVGESAEQTVLTFDDFALKKNTFGEEMGTSGTASFYVYATGFVAENMTFENTAGPVGQAVAVMVAADMAAFFNCRFLGFQDTLYANGGGNRQYYKNCFIQGATDFIFGSATAVFEGCEIFSKKGGQYITAASTPDTVAFGYVFLRCRLTGDAPEGKVFLGRPWRPYAKTVFINSQLGGHIAPAGWHNWNKPDAEKTSFYAEYGNSGPGAVNQRVKWSHLLNSQQAASFNLTNIFKNWDPNSIERLKP